MTGDDPLGADNDLRYGPLVWDTAPIDKSGLDPEQAFEKLAELCEQLGLYDFPADAAGNVAGSDSSGLPATPKPHH